MKIVKKVIDHPSEESQGPAIILGALINPKNGENITGFYKCKDFFNDVFWSRATGKEASIYGVKWSPKKHDEILSEDYLLYAMEIKTNQFHTPIHTLDAAEKMLVLLNMFEKALHLKRSSVEMSDDNDYTLVKFSRGWTKYPHLNSLFFYLTRIGLVYDGKSDPITFFSKFVTKDFPLAKDEMYWRSIHKVLGEMLKGDVDKSFKYELSNSISDAHVRGIVYYSKQQKK